MSRRQMIFSQMFQGQTYGPRGDFEPRDWQIECADQYASSVSEWQKSHENNGAGTQHRYCVYGGTGCGKTKAVGLLASNMLNRKLVSQIVLVCPNRSIRRKTQKDFLSCFGIDLAIFHARKHADGVGRARQGYIFTYPHMIQDPILHRRICGPDTLVIFDEVHHLGDGSGWGDAAIEAYGRVNFVITLTGTPYRPRNEKIPFVTYEETEVNGLARFKADGLIGFTYSLGRAIAEGVCREPLFQFHGDKDTVIIIRPHPDAGELKVTYETTKISEAHAALRLRGSVEFGSPARLTLLKQALDKCREECRKVAIFLGGDTNGDHTPTVDATKLLPADLREIGISEDEYEIVTGDDLKAQLKIESFGASKKWILVSINMVSEGTDIPELSAAIFLTTITAKQTTVQRIGRVLRLMGPGDHHRDALIFMFKDGDLLALSDEIKDEITREIKIIESRKRRGPTENDDEEPPRYRAEATCISGGDATLVKFGNRSWPIAVFEEARRKLREHRVSPTMLEVALTLMLRESDGHC